MEINIQYDAVLKEEAIFVNAVHNVNGFHNAGKGTTLSQQNLNTTMKAQDRKSTTISGVRLKKIGEGYLLKEVWGDRHSFSIF